MIIFLLKNQKIEQAGLVRKKELTILEKQANEAFSDLF